MSDEHLYPARAGMLREGTPIRERDRCGWVVHVGSEHGRDYARVTLREDGRRRAVEGAVPLDLLRLDLRDVTARAHAAMAYTATCSTGADIGPACETVCMFGGVVWDGPYAAVLCRMRCLDLNVTIAEARAALDWAHAASGGQP